MMTDLLADYQRDLNADLKKLTTDLAQVLVAAGRAVEEFNAATAARGVAFEAEMAERMRHFREGPREEQTKLVVASSELAPQLDPAMIKVVYQPIERMTRAEAFAGTFVDPAAVEKFEANLNELKGPAMPNIYDTAGAP